jgi:hypothetical protein
MTYFARPRGLAVALMEYLQTVALDGYAILDRIGYEIALRSSFKAPSWTTAWEAAACPFSRDNMPYLESSSLNIGGNHG